MTLKIGHQDEELRINRSLLKACSIRFRARLEAQPRQQSFTLPTATLTEVHLFKDWLYSGRTPEHDLEQLNPKEDVCKSCNLPTADCQQSLRAVTADQVLQRDRELELHIESGWQHELLYIFAERYDVAALRRAIIDDLWFFYQSHNDAFMPHAEDVYVLRKIGPLPPLYRFIVGLYARSYDPNREENCGTDRVLRRLLPNDFSAACLKVFESTVGIPVLKNLCAYHEHDQGEATVQTCTENVKTIRMQKHMEMLRALGVEA